MEGQLTNMLVWVITIVIFLSVFLPQMFKIMREYERGVVFRLGKYQSTKGPGFIILIPFIDKVERVDLRVLTINVDKQEAITKDNVTVNVDAITFFRVVDAEKAVIQVERYIAATSMLAQTTLRSVIGQFELDEILAEREKINKKIQDIIDKQTDPWGVKVTRYEVKNIVPPQSIKDAMEKQMRAEREKRAIIAESEGDRQAKINRAEGDRQELIARSEGEKQKRINEAEGRAAEIEKVAVATAEGIRQIALAINEKGGSEAVNLRVAEQYIQEFGKLAQTNNSMIIPSDLSDMAGLIATAMSVIKKDGQSGVA